MRMLQHMIGDEISARGADTITHITSIGSGPAKEVSNYLQADEIPGRASFTLIDQELSEELHRHQPTSSET